MKKTAVAAVAAVLLILLLHPERLIEVVEGPSELVNPSTTSDPNVLSRYALWDAAVDVSAQSPVIGHGFGSAAGLAARVPIVNPLRDFHSVYFQLLVELGALGMAFWLVLVLRSVWHASRAAVHKESALGYLFAALMVTFLVNGVTANLLLGGVGTVMFAFLAVDIRRLLPRGDQEWLHRDDEEVTGDIAGRPS
jgi:O-antigen ligase